jgi:hypothetical protein
VEYYKELEEKFPVQHDILEATNLNKIIVKAEEETHSRTKQIIKTEMMTC